MNAIDFGLFFYNLKELERAIESGKSQGIKEFVLFPQKDDPTHFDWGDWAQKWQVKLHLPHLFFKEGKFRLPRKLKAKLCFIPESIQLQEAYAHFLKAHDYGSLIISFPHEKSLCPQGIAHEGVESFTLGLPELSPLQESLRVARDCELAQYFGISVHFPQISSQASLETIRSFRSRGCKITAGVGALHLLHTIEDVVNFEGKYKTLPPLRSKRDQMSIWAALNDGTISTLCSGLVSYQDEINFFESPMGTHALGDFLPRLKEIFSRAPYSLGLLEDLISHNPQKILKNFVSGVKLSHTKPFGPHS